MDLQMPEMNGFEATEYIRNSMNLKIPIIALTADVTTVDLEKCKVVGMNDYIAKPVNEKLLYSKILGLVKKPVEKNVSVPAAGDGGHHTKERYTDLAYLINITHYDRKLMMEMISLYLEQTPSLIGMLKKSIKDEDPELLYAAAHKLIPSFSIMGIAKQFENIAKKLQEFSDGTAGIKNNTASYPQPPWGKVQELVTQLEMVCNRACAELEEEYIILKNTIA